jgi:hypothetical protein
MCNLCTLAPKPANAPTTHPPRNPAAGSANAIGDDFVVAAVVTSWSFASAALCERLGKRDDFAPGCLLLSSRDPQLWGVIVAAGIAVALFGVALVNSE